MEAIKSVAVLVVGNIATERDMGRILMYKQRRSCAWLTGRLVISVNVRVILPVCVESRQGGCQEQSRDHSSGEEQVHCRVQFYPDEGRSH